MSCSNILTRQTRPSFLRCLLGTLALTISVIAGSGCQWDPPHTNPIDPNYSIPRPSLLFQVKGSVDRVERSIVDATVTISALGRYAQTDGEGLAYFDDIPAGVWWVAAFRQTETQPFYALDSVEVTVSGNVPSYSRIRLDALPHFQQAVVNEMTIKRRSTDIIQQIRLKAFVEDADGPTDLKAIRWRFREMTGALSYNQDPDSAFWEVIIPSDSFPQPSGIGDAMNAPFIFEAFDGDSNSVQQEARLARILSDQELPNLSDPTPDRRPTFAWTYPWYFVFPSIEDFKYRLMIFGDDLENEAIVYDTLITSGSTHQMKHVVAYDLRDGSYFSYLYVIDNFGNYARTEKKRIQILPGAN